MDEQGVPGPIKRQPVAEFRYVVALILGLGFLLGCLVVAIWAGALESWLGIWGIVVLGLALAAVLALIGWELWRFARRSSGRGERTPAP
jgi:membrane protein implicated in regulation of membrane protease activity